MKEYRVHYIDKEEKKERVFYFLDYNDINALFKDLAAMEFESEYGEVLFIEKDFIVECVDDLETQPPSVPA